MFFESILFVCASSLILFLLLFLNENRIKSNRRLNDHDHTNNTQIFAFEEKRGYFPHRMTSDNSDVSSHVINVHKQIHHSPINKSRGNIFFSIFFLFHFGTEPKRKEYYNGKKHLIYFFNLEWKFCVNLKKRSRFSY